MPRSYSQSSIFPDVSSLSSACDYQALTKYVENRQTMKIHGLIRGKDRFDQIS